MLEALVVRVQEEVLEAVGDVVVSQELQVVLIKLEFQRVLVMDLEAEGQNGELDSGQSLLIIQTCSSNHISLSLQTGWRLRSVGEDLLYHLHEGCRGGKNTARRSTTRAAIKQSAGTNFALVLTFGAICVCWRKQQLRCFF